LSTGSGTTGKRDLASFVSIRIEPETGVAIAACSGTIGAKEAREGASALWSHPDWNGIAVVWDFRAARFELSPSDTRAIARFVLQNQRATPPARVAFVAERDVDFGMARIFEVYRKQREIDFHVFRSYDEAVAWARPGASSDA
jgi:hypothetical protein